MAPADGRPSAPAFAAVLFVLAEAPDEPPVELPEVVPVDPVRDDAPVEPHPRVRALTPELSKGLEFDLVVLVDPQSFGAGIEGAVDRYVAMTRATQQLVILTSP